MTDSLSNIVTQEETFTRGNSKKIVLKDLMAEEAAESKANVGIKENEAADKAAKEVLNQNVDNTYKVVKSDWIKWVKRKSWPVRQNEWKSSGNLMATVKPNIREYSSTEGLAQQVVVSRLRMGYTNITHAHRLSDDSKPYCNECEQDLTV
jgi:hypothetical protein